MRAWYVNRRNDSILDAKLMLMFAAALLMILAFLLPRDQTFRTMLAAGEADRVSISYARLLLRIDPDDAELRQLLAGQYYQLGRHNDAWTVLKYNNAGRSILGVKVLQKITYSWPAGSRRNSWKRLLTETLQQVVARESITRADLTELARIALSLGRADIAAVLEERVYRITGSDIDLLRAARSWIAADAADRALLLIQRDNTRNNPALLGVAIDAALAAGDPAAALPLIDEYIASRAPNHAQIIDFIQVGLAANDHQRVKRYLTSVTDVSELTLKQATRLSQAAIASGELSLALTFMEHALAQGGDQIELSSQAAQVYEWAGRPDEAMQMWLRVADQQNDTAALERGWRLGLQLYQYTNVSLLLTRLAEKRRLDNEEVTALRRSYEQRGDPYAGDGVLKRYVRSYPTHEQAWRELIALQTRNLKLAHAESSWREFSRHHLLEDEDYGEWAKLIWRQYRAEEAMALLQTRNTSTNPSLWRQLASYAWYLDDTEVASNALETLLALDARLESNEYQQLVTSTIIDDNENALDHAIAAYQAHPDNPQFLFVALQLAVQRKDIPTADTLFLRALAATGPVAELTQQADFWALNAQHLQHINDYPGALRALHKALDISPDAPSLRAAVIWLLLAQRDDQALQEALAEYAPQAVQQPPLWAAMASGYARLKDHRTAAYWYGRVVPQNATDTGLLLAYGGTLEALGRVDPAYRLRQLALKNLLREASSTGELDTQTLMWASRDMLSGPDQKSLLLRLLNVAKRPADRQREVVSTALSQFELADGLRREHYSAARYWLHHTQEGDVHQRLAVALESHDKESLGRLLDNKDPRVRSEAARGLGSQKHSLAFNADERGRVNPANSTLAFGAPQNGWQLQPIWNETGNVTFAGTEFKLRGKLFDRRYETDLRLEDVTIDGQLAKRRYREVNLASRLHFANFFGDALFGLKLTQGGLRSFVGAEAQQTIRIDRRNSVFARAELRSPITGGGIAQALLDRSGVELGWNTQPARRHSINANLSAFGYRDHEDNKVGNSFGLTLNHALAVLRSGTSADIVSSLQLTGSGSETISPSAQALLRAPGSGLLPQTMQRITVGAVLWRDNPGELNWQRSGPRYRLQGNVGYQWPQRQITFDTDVSLGIPVFGRDELSIRAGFTSALQNQGGEKGIRAQLSYSRYLNW